jgi:hypothetical protein
MATILKNAASAATMTGFSPARRPYDNARYPQEQLPVNRR